MRHFGNQTEISSTGANGSLGCTDKVITLASARGWNCTLTINTPKIKSTWPGDIFVQVQMWCNIILVPFLYKMSRGWFLMSAKRQSYDLWRAGTADKTPFYSTEVLYNKSNVSVPVLSFNAKLTSLTLEKLTREDEQSTVCLLMLEKM